MGKDPKYYYFREKMAESRYSDINSKSGEFISVNTYILGMFEFCPCESAKLTAPVGL